MGKLKKISKIKLISILNMKKNNKVKKEIQKIIDYYNSVIETVAKKAKAAKGRAYGGVVRAIIGELVQDIAKRLILISLSLLDKNPQRISFPTDKIKIPIKKDYIEKIKNPEIKKFLLDNIGKCYYGQKTDLHMFVNEKFIMGVECKAYTENAMMKRILVDFTLLKQVYPDLDCVLFQLESQLGGDYPTLRDKILGSFPTHTLISYFDIDLHIITLLQRERKVDQPIHISEYYKPLTKESLDKAIQTFKGLLRKYK